MRELDESLIKDLSNQIVRMGGSLLTITFGESPNFEGLVSRRTAVPHANGAVDRLFGGHKLILSSYENESDWISLFTEMDSTIFEELGGKTIAQAYFSHMNMREFKLENEVPLFCKALKTVYGESALKDVNLRRVFVGIRYSLLTTALDSINKRLSTITNIPEKTWFEALRFSAQA